MGVYDIQSHRLLGHVLGHSDQYTVFEHVSVVGGVKGMAITEHGMDGNRLSRPQKAQKRQIEL
jgi:hypothetical protein